MLTSIAGGLLRVAQNELEVGGRNVLGVVDHDGATLGICNFYARGYVPAVFAQSPGLCHLFGFRLSFRERFGAAVL
jgi:hypothetical protein